MHRLILGLNDSKIHVDHADGDGLNNQRSNIRIATYSQNKANSRPYRNGKSGFKGVYISNNKWRAVIRNNGIIKHLGYFSNEIGAAIAYNNAAKRLFGEFANLNTMPKTPVEVPKVEP